MKKKWVAFISIFTVLSITVALTIGFSTAGSSERDTVAADKKETNLTAKISSTPSAPAGEAKLYYCAKDLNSLIKDSSLIVVAQVTENQTEETFQRVNFAITQLNVTRILKDNGLISNQISLLQTVADFDPTVAKGSTVLLFLEKYEGPIPGTANAYVCKGLYQGNYIINGDKIVPTRNDNAQLTSDIQKMQGLDAMKLKVESIVSMK